jgi:hypothetical protein
MATQWFRYAMGRLETADDKCVLDVIQKKFTGAGLRVSDLLLAIVESDAFRTFQALK